MKYNRKRKTCRSVVYIFNAVVQQIACEIHQLSRIPSLPVVTHTEYQKMWIPP